MTERKDGRPQITPEGPKIRHLKKSVNAGALITSAIAEAIQQADEFKAGKMLAEVTFDFNGVNVTVRKDSDPRLIRRDWNRALNGYMASEVGPYPPAELTEEEIANDARIKAENEARHRAEDEKRLAEERVHRERVEAKLKDAPAIELAHEDVWQEYKAKNTDFYGGGIISYSERWARLMQVEIAQGKKLKEVADSTSHEADIDGISGAMYGAAVSTLANTWVHGEELRRWNNPRLWSRTKGPQSNY
jgi:hypothetical protein